MNILQSRLDEIESKNRGNQFKHEINKIIRKGYKDIDLSYPPIIGVDVSGATFNDSSAITIIDSHTTEVCANLHCNFIPADDLADVIYQIVTKYMPNSIINIERNGARIRVYSTILMVVSYMNNMPQLVA